MRHTQPIAIYPNQLVRFLLLKTFASEPESIAKPELTEPIHCRAARISLGLLGLLGMYEPKEPK